MEKLRTYLNSLHPDDQMAFAIICGPSLNYLRKAISRGQQLGPELAIAIQAQSDGAVTVEDLRPDVPWHVLRSSSVESIGQ